MLKEPLAVFNRAEYPDYHKLLTTSLGTTSGKLRIVEECDGDLSLIAAVSASRAIALSAESIMSVAGSRVVFVPLSPPPAPLKVGVCFSDTAPPIPPLRRFVETAESTVASR